MHHRWNPISEIADRYWRVRSDAEARFPDFPNCPKGPSCLPHALCPFAHIVLGCGSSACVRLRWKQVSLAISTRRPDGPKDKSVQGRLIQYATQTQ